MKKRISQFSVHQTSLTIGVMYTIGAAIVAVFFAAISLISGNIPGVLLAIVLPVAYGLLSYAFMAVVLLLYNFAATKTGGVEFTLTE